MPLDAADPRPRNPFGQFSPGAALSPDQMNRAYGIRTKVLASILSTRPTMKTIPALPAKDIARLSGLAAKALIKDRATPSRVALSALAKRAVELAAPAPVVGDKIQRPQFVEDGGYVKIVRPDGTASEIGRAPGMMNRIRRNKDKLIVGGLTAAVGGAFARELLRGRRLGKKA